MAAGGLVFSMKKNAMLGPGPAFTVRLEVSRAAWCHAQCSAAVAGCSRGRWCSAGMAGCNRGARLALQLSFRLSQPIAFSAAMSNTLHQSKGLARSSPTAPWPFIFLGARWTTRLPSQQTPASSAPPRSRAWRGARWGCCADLLGTMHAPGSRQRAIVHASGGGNVRSQPEISRPCVARCTPPPTAPSPVLPSCAQVWVSAEVMDRPGGTVYAQGRALYVTPREAAGEAGAK